MSQDLPSATHSNREVADSQATLSLNWRKGPEAEEIVQLLHLRAAMETFGLTKYQLYLAVRRRELRPVQLGGKGRIYYLEDELRALAARLKCAYTLAGAA